MDYNHRQRFRLPDHVTAYLYVNIYVPYLLNKAGQYRFKNADTGPGIE